MLTLHSVLEHKKLYSNFGKFKKCNSGFFWSKKRIIVNVQGNKKRNTQNIQVKKQKKPNDVELFFVDKPKRSHRVDYSAMAKGHKAKKSK